jgi:hypothetical protein
MRDSVFYRGAVHIFDGIRYIVRHPRTKSDIDNLFVGQMENVRQMNELTIFLAKTYEGDLTATQRALDTHVTNASRNTSVRTRLETELPENIKLHDTTTARLAKLDPVKDNEQYYAVVQEYITSMRATREKREKLVMAAFSQAHNHEAIEGMIVQEEIFHTMMYRMVQMGLKTQAYQQRLSENYRVWKAVIDLSKAVKHVGDGVRSLVEWHKQLERSYITAVHDITSIVDNHRGLQLMQNSNTRLRNLLQDVQASGYRDVIMMEAPSGGFEPVS